MNKITITTKQKKYPIFINNFSPAEIVDMAKTTFASDRFFLIIDANVNRLHKKFMDELLLLLGSNTHHFVFQATEKSKSFSKLNQILQSMLRSELSRSSLIIAIGGGITGDMSAFAASIFMRGIKIIHIPTTLISAVDSSIGGKTGINFLNNKNFIGTFCHPDCVIVNTAFLKTLPKIEINSGMGEVIKYAFLADKSFFNYISDNITLIKNLNETTLHKIIQNCLLIKSSIVQQDESEKGLRKILNYGHTFAHGIESASNFRIKHGLAVNYGLIMALIISKNLKILNEDKFNRLIKLPLKNLFTDKLQKISDDRLIYFLRHDKKNFDGQINLVLIKDIGELLIDVKTDKKDILKGFHDLKLLMKFNWET